MSDDAPDVLATLRARRAAADRREAGAGRLSSCFGSARSPRARRCRGARAAPHAIATAPPFTTRARAAVGAHGRAPLLVPWPDSAAYRPGRYARRTRGRGRRTLPRRPLYGARSSSCCRPPRGGRWAALLMLRFGTPYGLVDGRGGAGGAARDCYGATSLHALARPSCYRRAASVARALAGRGRLRPR